MSAAHPIAIGIPRDSRQNNFSASFEDVLSCQIRSNTSSAFSCLTRSNDNDRSLLVVNVRVYTEQGDRRNWTRADGRTSVFEANDDSDRNKTVRSITIERSSTRGEGSHGEARILDRKRRSSWIASRESPASIRTICWQSNKSKIANKREKKKSKKVENEATKSKPVTI
ncbi:hypothetical protein IEQ34_012205 [Dendrobium chrysotoxum]|uniref:Uncharacterized protein n=1 Tax=Dendrobium chrysotoxum TaxID=161865 RepID=A0AAV7GRV6_DENCH|nr:hypothetical protein IEQ34_012205 [Dendrobium chrysotoxum]